MTVTMVELVQAMADGEVILLHNPLEGSKWVTCTNVEKIIRYWIAYPDSVRVVHPVGPAISSLIDEEVIPPIPDIEATKPLNLLMVRCGFLEGQIHRIKKELGEIDGLAEHADLMNCISEIKEICEASL